MNPGLKKVVFRKLNLDLSKVEIILAENHSIWFIDRANKYWYFELEKSGKLWWRYEFFTDFFILFSLKIDEFQPLLSEWVEGIFDSNVNMTPRSGHRLHSTVEGILNHGYRKGSRKIDEALNREINEIDGGELFNDSTVVKVLNIDINETIGTTIREPNQIIEVMNREDILNHKVVSISHGNELIDIHNQILLNELVYEVESADPLDTPAHDSVDEVLKYKVTRTIPDLSESLTEIDILLNQ